MNAESVKARLNIRPQSVGTENLKLISSFIDHDKSEFEGGNYVKGLFNR